MKRFAISQHGLMDLIFAANEDALGKGESFA
jgi:hypothetical protein